MLWLALFLPRLPLDALPESPPPSVVVDRERIVAADDTAGQAGIVPGLRLASAHARLPGLVVRARDPAREAAALERLACWAGGFTSEVSLAPPATLLLDIAGSLRLFGGSEALFPRIAHEAAAQGFHVQAALAPTPLAAQWLAGAGAGNDRPCVDLAALPARLGALALGTLALPPAQEARLAAFGARTLADVLSLPRAGLARRLGGELAGDLARALGELPDPRERFVFPERFAARIDLPARSESAMALSFAARRLIAALCGWLAARAAGIRGCVLELHCERGVAAMPALCLPLAFAEATRDAQRIGRVLDERLARLQLPAAVESLHLRADSPEPLAGREASLFSAGSAGGNTADCGSARIAELVERLQARLGDDRVYRLAAVADHRPENATQHLPVSGGSQPGHARGRGKRPPLVAAGPPQGDEGPLGGQRSRQAAQRGGRPLWMLPVPQALPENSGRPQRGGPLQFLAGPERIESGWWDEGEAKTLGDVRRDYFIALSPRAECLWIFRSADGWFLHGLFA